MRRRAASGLRFVHAAFMATPTSSMNFRGSTPLSHGFVLILTHIAAHAGSHSLSVANARSHGPGSGGWPVAAAALSFLLLIALASPWERRMKMWLRKPCSGEHTQRVRRSPVFGLTH